MSYIDPQGLQQQNANTGAPTHIQGGYSDHFILGSTLLADYPNLLSTYFKNGGKKVPFLNKLKAMGFVKGNMKASDSPLTGHYEKPRTKDTFGISAIITSPGSPVAGKAIKIAILATDMVSVTDSFSNTSTFSRPRVGENYKYTDGNTYRVIAKDQTTNPHQITLQPRLSTVDATAGIVVGAKNFYVNPDKGEGTQQIKPLKAQRFKYQNGFTIMDETEIVSGSNQTTKVSFKPVPGKDNLLYLEGIEDTEIRHEEAKSKFFIWAEVSDQLTDYSALLDETVQLKGSEGLIPFIRTAGKIFNFTDVDSYDIDDIFAVSNYYKDLAIGVDTVMILAGRNLINRKDLALKDFLDNTRVSYVVANNFMKTGMANAKSIDPEFNPEAMFVSLEFNGYHLGDINYVITAIPEFSDIYGAGNIGYKDVQIGFPIGMFQSEDKSMVPYVGLEWRGVDGYSRENEVWSTSGAGHISSQGSFSKCLADDGTNLYMRSEIAPHFALGIQMFIQKPTTMLL